MDVAIAMQEGMGRTVIKLLIGAVFGGVATFLPLLALEYIDFKSPDVVFHLSPSVALKCGDETFGYQQITVANVGNEPEGNVTVKISEHTGELLHYEFKGFGSPIVSVGDPAADGDDNFVAVFETLIPGAVSYLTLQMAEGAAVSAEDIEVYGDSGYAREAPLEYIEPRRQSTSKADIDGSCLADVLPSRTFYVPSSPRPGLQILAVLLEWEQTDRRRQNPLPWRNRVA